MNKYIVIAASLIVGVIFGSCILSNGGKSITAQETESRYDIHELSRIKGNGFTTESVPVARVIEVDGCKFVLATNGYADGGVAITPLRPCESK